MNILKDQKPEADADLKTFEKFEGQCYQLATLAEKAERYEDMCQILTELVKSKCGRQELLNNEERNLLSVAFKNVVGALRSSWRTFSQSDDSETDNKEMNAKYSGIIEGELEAKCLEVLKILEEQLIPAVKKEKEKNPDIADTLVFYLKMCGDYYRYLAEFRDSEEYKEKARTSYSDAFDEAKQCLPETHPTRLGLALNFSVCYYEILKEPREACKLAKQAFDAAIQKLDTLNDANYKDSTLIMQLLRDNLTLWTTDDDQNDQGRED